MLIYAINEMKFLEFYLLKFYLLNDEFKASTIQLNLQGHIHSIPVHALDIRLAVPFRVHFVTILQEISLADVVSDNVKAGTKCLVTQENPTQPIPSERMSAQIAG